MTPPTVYLIASRHERDVDAASHLETLLFQAIKRKEIVLFHRGMIKAGELVESTWRKRLDEARVVVMLSSPDLFVDREDEMAYATERFLSSRSGSGAPALVPIRFRPTLPIPGEFGGVVQYPAEGKTLSQRSDASAHWVAIVKEILALALGEAGGVVGTSGGRPPPAGLIRVMMLAANPPALVAAGGASVDMVPTAMEIQRRLRESEHRERFDLLALELKAEVTDLVKLMRRKPHLLHILSHGTNEGHIVLSAGGREGAAVAIPALAKLLAVLGKDAPRGVLLNACFSRAQALPLAEVVDFVVCATGELPNRTAWAFSVGFYSSLAEGDSVDTAFRFGIAEAMLLQAEHVEQYQLVIRPGVDPATLRLV